MIIKNLLSLIAGMETDPNLTPIRQSLPAKSGKQVSVRLRPAVMLTGIVLVAWGGWGLVTAGLGTLISVSALVCGMAIMFVNWRLGRSGSSKRLAVDVQESREAHIKNIRREISKVQYLENISELGEQTAKQLDEIFARYEVFKKTLNQKFNSSELTFARYHGAAEQTFYAILDNLQKAAAVLNGLNVIDTQSLEKQINQAKAIAGTPDLPSLLERKALREKQVKGVTDLLSFNEKAITEFDRLNSALLEINTQKGLADTHLEPLMQEMAMLAERAKKYSSVQQ